MSETGSCRSPGSRLSYTNLRRDGRNGSALRTLAQGMPTFALGVVVTLLYVAIDGRQVFTKPGVANFTLMDMFAFALLGLFSSSMASMTFRPRLPMIASLFESITVIFVTFTFGSLACILTRVHHGIVFSACMVPLLPLAWSPCVLLLRYFNWIIRKFQNQFRAVWLFFFYFLFCLEDLPCAC